MQKWQKDFEGARTFIRHGEYYKVDSEVWIKNHETIYRRIRYTAAVVCDDQTSAIAIAISVCDPRDQFNRKIGRTIAVGRAKRALNSQRHNVAEYHGKVLRVMLGCDDESIANLYHFDDPGLIRWIQNAVLPRLSKSMRAA